MGTSTSEPGLRLCLSCFEKHSSCCVVFMPRLGYCTVSSPSGTTSSWKSCKVNIAVCQHSVLVAACSLAGLSGLTLVVLGHGSSLADSKTWKQPIFILLASSWSTGASELPWAGAAKGRLEPRTHTSCLDPEEQSSRKDVSVQAEGIARESAEIVDQISPFQ